MLRAMKNGSPITLPAEATIADGIAVVERGSTLPVVERYVDEIVTVDEEEIANAIMVLLEGKTVAEGAGAVALAGLLPKKTSLKGKRTAVLVCGGNIDVSLLSEYRTRFGEGWPPGTHSRPSCRSAGCSASTDENPLRSAGKHCRDPSQSCLLRRQSGRYSHRHHTRNARRCAYHRDWPALEVEGYRYERIQ